MAFRALVVGGTSGIGYAMACRIAAETNSSSVIVSGRTKPQNLLHANIEFRPLEATSMREIKQYTDAVKFSVQGQQLDLLIMSQGILSFAGRSETPEGIDRKMALHYYGKQLLIRELLPALKDDAKVIIVFDGKFGSPDKLNWDDLDLKTHFSLGTSANHCMAMNDAMVQWWAAQQQRQGTHSRHFVHAWPGVVDSNPGKNLSWYIRTPMQVLGGLVGVSPDTCAERLLKGASECAAAGKQQGRFWSNIDNKGRLISNKAIWSDEQMNKIADHTWRLVDGALGAFTK
ncbi:Dehydrogenase/reductase SDR family member on chromosome X [Madurella mycetomatis]|uniref:Dehydrogenase/reductase SDR family member on chromosome X n=1 Tax=Madurella mycetomatis TaxID=100816 RepID=A0A175WF98_9PEZI|nr:Dehydrogenase/reductase SDR family member on chromosome X [Madurella mycetomatis]